MVNLLSFVRWICEIYIILKIILSHIWGSIELLLFQRKKFRFVTCIYRNAKVVTVFFFPSNS